MGLEILYPPTNDIKAIAQHLFNELFELEKEEINALMDDFLSIPPSEQ